MIELTVLFVVGFGVAILVLGALLWGLVKLAFGLVLLPLKLLLAVAAGVFLLFLLPIGLVVLLPLLVVVLPLALLGGAVALVCHAI